MYGVCRKNEGSFGCEVVARALGQPKSSRQREFHPKPLTKPYGKLSLHTAFVNFKPVTK